MVCVVLGGGSVACSAAELGGGSVVLLSWVVAVLLSRVLASSAGMQYSASERVTHRHYVRQRKEIGVY